MCIPMRGGAGVKGHLTFRKRGCCLVEVQRSLRGIMADARAGCQSLAASSSISPGFPENKRGAGERRRLALQRQSSWHPTQR